MKLINNAWTHGLTESEAKEIKELVVSSKYVLSELERVLTKKKLESRNESTQDYDCPNWAYKQADTCGYRRALQDVINIITIKEKTQ